MHYLKLVLIKIYQFLYENFSPIKIFFYEKTTTKSYVSFAHYSKFEISVKWKDDSDWQQRNFFFVFTRWTVKPNNNATHSINQKITSNTIHTHVQFALVTNPNALQQWNEYSSSFERFFSSNSFLMKKQNKSSEKENRRCFSIYYVVY